MESVEADGQLPSGRNTQQVALFQAKRARVGAVEAGREQFNRSAFESGAIDDCLTVRGKARSRNCSAPKRQAMERRIRRWAGALAHKVNAKTQRDCCESGECGNPPATLGDLGS